MSEMCTDKKSHLWCEWPYKRGTNCRGILWFVNPLKHRILWQLLISESQSVICKMLMRPQEWNFHCCKVTGILRIYFITKCVFAGTELACCLNY